MEVQKLCIENWSTVRDLFKENWPKHILAYYTLQNYISWHLVDPELVQQNVSLFSVSSKDGTFMLLDETMVYFYSLSDHPDLVELKALFEKLNPNVAYTGICIYDRFLHIFNELHKIGQLKTFKIIESASGTLYFYSHTKVQDLQVECPKGINLQRIFSEKDVKKAADAYPFKNDHTFHRFQLLAKFNPNFGAFNAQNELLAWCFQHESGMLTALQVLHDHQKRHGLGSTIVKFMIKELAQQNVDTLACVVDENYVSKRLFENIGFQIIDRLHLIEF